MTTYPNHDRLVIFDADGTTIDAFHAVEQSFLRHGMALGDLERFQKRRKLFKYLGGLREFPNNLRRQFGKQNRKRLLSTLTEFYRHEACLYPGIDALLRTLLATPDVRVGMVTRNVTIDPEETLACLFRRHGIDTREFDFLVCLPLREDKTLHFRRTRERYAINPARAYACGDEYSDYRAAIGAAMCPFVVAYGAEDRLRLTNAYNVPEECIVPSPDDFRRRLLHTLDLPIPGIPEQG
ncbi:haloacid dehalogenase [Azoarcus sp. CIB]|uniref:HAD family hydrolase n=1 Tax=Aromatoleum sp. (strain CIB) TaxID=198107 RepID=UPI00067D2C28|nr:HAD family hydrolase [Azoarcus sp. CIB]AKU11128.1 haloacid dehalogenase [Azoarcus sp. CIB]